MTLFVQTGLVIASPHFFEIRMFEIVSDTAGSEVKFDEHGDGLARYEILNFRKSEHNGTNGYQYQASENTRSFFHYSKLSFFLRFFFPLSAEQKSRRKFLVHARSNIEKNLSIIIGFKRGKRRENYSWRKFGAGVKNCYKL